MKINQKVMTASDILDAYSKGVRTFIGVFLDGNGSLAGANLEGAQFQSANFANVDMRGANLENAKISKSVMFRAILTGANLKNTQLFGTDLLTAKIDRACLVKANLGNTCLAGAMLTGSDLTDVDLDMADLRGTFLENALLRGASFGGTSFLASHLAGADFTNAKFSLTTFGATDLKNAKGLDKAMFIGPSSIGTDTLALSEGHIPESFLKGCGLSDWEILAARLYDPELPRETANDIIVQMENLRFGSAIQIHPLFISYSHKDGAFVDEIQRQLDKLGVRHWRDVHNSTSGPLEKQIDRAIRLHQTVLLVLSKDSVEGDWVEWEATKARELEKAIDKHVLCPIALDDAWKSCSWSGSLRNQIQKYNILDFSGWQDEGVMENQFKRLIKGMKIFY